MKAAIQWFLFKPTQAPYFRSSIVPDLTPNQVLLLSFVTKPLVRIANNRIVLSMAVFQPRDYYITSSADAVVAKHPLPSEKGIWNTELKPIKICPTKHSGQQGLRIRSDGKIFATAGWDARVRVYSAKKMKEIAVLKWHKMGCYAVALSQTDDISAPEEETADGESRDKTLANHSSSVQQKRDEKAQTIHWLAAGSKDGKVSLWDIY